MDLLDHFLESKGVSTDTRQINEGQMFFALKGPNFNGNQYVETAFANGATLAVVDDKRLKNHEKCFWVPDVLEALQGLARQYRQTLSYPIIGLTGSNGKTSTKELLQTIFSSVGVCYATKGNLNNHIGVPLTLLSLPIEANYAIIEMGANHQKEIQLLAGITQPDFAMITNIGMAHIEGFGSREGIAKGKFELFEQAMAQDKPILYRADSYLIGSWLNQYNKVIRISENHQVCIGAKTFRFQSDQLNPSIKGQIIEGDELFYFQSALFGAHNFNNIVMAAATALYFGIEPAVIARAIELYIPNNNRSERRMWRGASLILDAYNANPDSMKAAVQSFAAQTSGKKSLLILGEMKELGTHSKEEHQSLIELIESCSFSNLCLVGNEWRNCSIPDHMLHFDAIPSLQAYISQFDVNGYDILVKGSRSNQLESIFV